MTSAKPISNKLLVLAVICSSAIIDTAFATPLRPSHSVLALVPPRARAARFTDSDVNKDGCMYPSKPQEECSTNNKNCNSVLLHNTIASKFSATALRGGSDSAAPAEKDSSSKRKKIVGSIVLSALAILVASNRKSIAAFDFKGELATRLDYLASLGTPGIVMYIVGFMIWEITVGVTTPVETAAGMAFGLKNGIIANAIGKTSGAFIAFLLGRYVLKDFVQDKLKGNELMELVEDSIVEKPVRVALIWRFSFLPEQIKNFGLAVLPVKTWQFVTAVLMHGFPFTLLWSFVGAEMGQIVRGTLDAPSRTLKILLGGVYVFGFFISPSMVGLWVKGLRDKKLKKEAAAGK